MKKNYEALILGGGGHSKVILDILLKEKYKTLGILDRAIPAGKRVLNVDVIGTEKVIEEDEITFEEIFIGIGFHPKNKERSMAFTRLKKMGLNISSVLSPQAYISKESNLGEGVHILTNASVHAGVQIADNSIVNTKSSIDHDSIIGKDCHLSPGSIICGNCSVGNNVYIGAGAVIINNISIGSNCLIAAGSTVYRDIPDNTTFYGKN